MLITPKKGEYLERLLRSPQTVFSTKEVALLWGGMKGGAAAVRLNNYVRKGKLLRIRHGLYAKDKNYNLFEAANRIYTPSYISFETVLASAGVTFQYYESVFVASYETRELICDGHKIKLQKMKSTILTDPRGIENKENFAIASPERALLDVLYRNKAYYFDNLGPINWEKVQEILPVYGGNKRMAHRVKELMERNKEENL